MKAFDHGEAMQLIKAGLENGTIRLHGCEKVNTESLGAASAKIDAAYLITLLNQLQKKPQGE